MPRQDDLVQRIRDSADLIREYEDILRLSTDPQERARARREIRRQRALIKDWLGELQLIAQTLPEDVQQLLAGFENKLAAPSPESARVAESAPGKVAANGDRQDAAAMGEGRLPADAVPSWTRASAGVSIDPRVLLNIVKDRFREQDLREATFYLLEETSAYENLRGETLLERAISLIETLRTRGKANSLVEYIRKFRPDINLQDWGFQ